MDNKETPRMTALKKYNVARGNLLLMVGLTAINVILAAVHAIPLLYVKNLVGSVLMVFLIPLFIFPRLLRKALTFPSNK